MTSFRRALIVGCIVGCVFSVFLNAANLRLALAGRLTLSALGADLGQPDEAFYFALVKDARDGHPSMGNSSLYEYRDAPLITGYALYPQALLARFTTIPFPSVILFGDLFFPAIAGLLIVLIMCTLVGIGDALLLSAILLSSTGFGWLRIMNPQATMTSFLVGLLIILADTDCRRPLIHAAGLSLVVLVQPIYAVYLGFVEVLLALYALRRDGLRQVLKQRAVIFLLPALIGWLQAFSVTSHGDPEILSDLAARRGLIESRLPAAPKLQIILAVLSLLSYRFPPSRFGQRAVLPLLGFAGILTLNQSLLHGHDAVFGLYYTRPLDVVVFLLGTSTLYTVLSRKAARITLILVLCVQFTTLAGAASHEWSLAHERSRAESASGIPHILAELERLPGDRIVLAPVEVSNMVPLLTRHHTFFTQYAHFEYVSDRELAERYLAQRAVFPLPAIQTVEGDPLVFGIAAGNLYARAKTTCVMLRTLRLTDQRCEDLRLGDFIRHQDVRRFIDAGAIDPADAFERYHVDTVIASGELPSVLRRPCTQNRTVGAYTIYDCRFGQ